jgi:hypothetical protein
MKIQLYLLVFTFFISTMGYAQTSYQTKRFAVKKQTKKNIRNLNKDYHFTIQSLESPFEGNTHYRHFLEDLKAKSALMYPYRPQASSMRKTNDVLDTMQVHHSFEGNLYNYSVPNDNTLAVNKDGIVLSAINTNIIFYDVKNDSLLKRVSLNVFSDTLDYVSNHQYDPKVIYDYQLDRFIVINLAGASSDNTTHIVVGFQNTDDVLGEWSFYALEGNPAK